MLSYFHFLISNSISNQDMDLSFPHTRGHDVGTCRKGMLQIQNHVLFTQGEVASLQRFVPATFPSEVQQVDRCATCRRDKIAKNMCYTGLKLSRHTRGHVAAISPSDVPTTFTSTSTNATLLLLHVSLSYTSHCHISHICVCNAWFGGCNMSLRHVPASWPLVCGKL